MMQQNMGWINPEFFVYIVERLRGYKCLRGSEGALII